MTVGGVSRGAECSEPSAARCRGLMGFVSLNPSYKWRTDNVLSVIPGPSQRVRPEVAGPMTGSPRSAESITPIPAEKAQRAHGPIWVPWKKNLRVLAAWSVVMDSGLAAVAAIRNDATKNSRALFVLPVGDEIVDYGGVRECRGVTEIAVLVLGDLAQDAAHDLARARLRQIGRELDEIGRGDRADLGAHPLHQFLAQGFARLLARHQGDIGIDALALDVVRIADHSGFRDFRMRDQRGFDFRGAHAVAGNVDHVVDAAGDPVIAVLVAAAAVAGEILARIGLEISVDEALVVAIDSAHLARPGIGDAQIAGGRALLHLAFRIDDLRHDAEERQCRRAGLERDGAGQRRDQNAAGLGLPPGIDDRAAAVADHAVIPFPGFRIDRFPSSNRKRPG